MRLKNNFANKIIVLCVGVSLVITGAVIYEYHRLDTVIPSGVLSALLGLWGGELLIIALRQIFGSDVLSQVSKDQQPSQTEEYKIGDYDDYGSI